MFVRTGQDPESSGRFHPWTVVAKDARWKYEDFKRHPERIRTHLEDFEPWKHHAGVERFYELLEWLNGPQSAFETNDCGLRPPRLDTNVPEAIGFREAIFIYGRLTLFFRDLKSNSAIERIRWLCEGLLRLDGEAPTVPAVMLVEKWPHFFVETRKKGHVVLLEFWVWGESEAAAMENLGDLYVVLLCHTKCLSAGVPPDWSAPPVADVPTGVIHK